MYTTIFGHSQACVERFVAPLNVVLAPSPDQLPYYFVALEENPELRLFDKNTNIMPQTNLYLILGFKEGYWGKQNWEF